MRFGIYCANFGSLGDPAVLVDLAERAERAGWEGYFLYDHVQIVPARAVPIVDPWSILAGVADRTKLTFGPLVTPVARRQPWELALQALTLNRLSEGRLVLGVGLGEALDFTSFGLDDDPAERARGLDEGLELLEQLWSAEPVRHTGRWTVHDACLAPEPVGAGIPIWVAGRYGRRAPMARAARFQGAFPIDVEWDVDRPLSAARLRETVSVLAELRGGLDGFEIVTAGTTPADPEQAGAAVAAHERSGATWWLEIIAPTRGTLTELQDRVDRGPPGPRPRGSGG